MISSASFMLYRKLLDIAIGLQPYCYQRSLYTRAKVPTGTFYYTENA